MAGIPETLKGRSYTRVSDWSRDELALALDLADELKQERLRRKELRVLPGRTIGMIFHKPSTRTRVAFEVGIAELGGMALYLPAADLQLARGESYRDTALVLSRFVSALLIRTFDQAEVDTFAEHASIPVLNGLTDLAHPLQALADAMTIRERLGGLEGVRLTYLGDGNNVCHSLMRLAARFGMHFTAACPVGYEPVRVGRGRRPGGRGRKRRLGAAHVRPAGGIGRGRRALHGRLDEHGPGRGAPAAAARPGALQPRRRAALGREPRGSRHALPARPRGRGDQRRRALRAEIARVGPGREPPPHPEGDHGARDPVTGSPVTFDDHVKAALDSLPPDLAAALDNVAVVVEDEHPDDPDLYGLYEGIPLPERGDMAGSLPDRITIFRLPLEDEFDDPADLEREIRITVLHELGHYFGLDEDRLAELGYE